MLAKILVKHWKHGHALAAKFSDVITGSADSLVAKVGPVCRVHLFSGRLTYYSVIIIVLASPKNVEFETTEYRVLNTNGGITYCRQLRMPNRR